MTFSEQNPEIEACMATHLIGLSQSWGVMEDDYRSYFQARCSAFREELKKRIIQDEETEFLPAIPASETGDPSAEPEEETDEQLVFS